MSPDSITANGKTVMVSLKFFLTMVLTILAFCGGFFLKADAEQGKALNEVKIVLDEKNKHQDVLIACNVKHQDFIQYTRIHGEEYKALVKEMKENNKENKELIAEAMKQNFITRIEMLDKLSDAEKNILKEIYKLTK